MFEPFIQFAINCITLPTNNSQINRKVDVKLSQIIMTPRGSYDPWIKNTYYKRLYLYVESLFGALFKNVLRLGHFDPCKIKGPIRPSSLVELALVRIKMNFPFLQFTTLTSIELLLQLLLRAFHFNFVSTGKSIGSYIYRNTKSGLKKVPILFKSLCIINYTKCVDGVKYRI